MNGSQWSERGLHITVPSRSRLLNISLTNFPSCFAHISHSFRTMTSARFEEKTSGNHEKLIGFLSTIWRPVIPTSPRERHAILKTFRTSSFSLLFFSCSVRFTLLLKMRRSSDRSRKRKKTGTTLIGGERYSIRSEWTNPFGKQNYWCSWRISLVSSQVAWSAVVVNFFNFLSLYAVSEWKNDCPFGCQRVAVKSADSRWRSFPNVGGGVWR